jgi:hypothetical protein
MARRSCTQNRDANDSDFVPAAEPKNAASRPPQPTRWGHGAPANPNVARQTGPPTRNLVVEDPGLREYVEIEVSDSTNEEASHSSQGRPTSNPPVACTASAADAPTAQSSQGSACVAHDINHFFPAGEERLGRK